METNSEGDQSIIDNPTVIHNQGCYAIIDEEKADRPAAKEIKVYDSGQYFSLQYWFQDGSIYTFRHDRIADVCIIEID